jgi:RHS repeat-associated protein
MCATYREDGHIMSLVDQGGGLTRYERDARGKLVKVTDALNRVTSWERDENGLPIVVTDAAGGVVRIERDARGNVLMVTDPLGAVTVCRYDERGLLTEQISPTGSRWTYAYDGHGNLVTTTLPTGGTFRFAFDGLGQLLSATDPLGAETRYSYSNRGDLVAIRGATGGVTRYSYDGEGHLTQATDPKGRATQLVWGGYHKVCERKDANGNIVRLRYNLQGELVEVHNERGEVHRLTYTVAGLLNGETTFDGRELRYRHDEAGRLVWVQNGAREVTNLQYDLVGQVVKRELDDGDVEEFTYDPLGNLIAGKGPAGEFLFERDALGRVVREAQVIGGKEHWTAISYDADGARVGRKTSLGHVEVVTRGALGERARTVLDETHRVEHQTDILGRETARGLPGGGWLQTVFDAMGRVSRRRAGGAIAESWGQPGQPEWVGARPEKLTVEKAFRYDEAGELAETWDQRRGSTRFAHDPMGRLLAMVPEKARAEVFRYDERGNPYESHDGAEERGYGPGNRLLRKGEWEYEWDAEGRLREKRRGAEKWRYVWDGAGLLKQVERPDGVRVELAYDPFARRVSKKVTRNGASRSDRVAVSETRFVWEGDVLVHEIEARARASGDPVVEERTYWFKDDGFEPSAHREKGGWFHYLNDSIGTPECLLAGDGSVACELLRTGWGKTEEAPGARAKTSIRFAGQYADPETGLHYNRFRYYDPETATFICADPIGIDGGLNEFGYVPDPNSWFDPFGLAATANMNLGNNLENKRKNELRAQGYSILPSKVGPGNGPDIIAVKRDASGAVVEMRIEECKANSSKLGQTKAGPQMSDPWLAANVAKMKKKGGATAQTAQAIEDFESGGGVIDKALVKGKQAAPGKRWKVTTKPLP